MTTKLNPSLEGISCVDCLQHFQQDELLQIRVGDNMQLVYFHTVCQQDN